jgi:hypothetical protein
MKTASRGSEEPTNSEKYLTWIRAAVTFAKILNLLVYL